MAGQPSKSFEFGRADPRLLQDASQRTGGNFAMSWHDRRATSTVSAFTGEFDVAAALTCFGEACCATLPHHFLVGARLHLSVAGRTVH
ncbi:MAG: hypothetical protein OXC31_28700 [Spirochaetaceae bacterium]|nr:hypothetical protein [Spirochaetaceae bacterium]